MTAAKVALLVAYGPEVRAFIHSGFAAALAGKVQVTVFTRVGETGAFREARGMEIQKAPEAREARSLAQVRSLANKAHQAFLRRRGRRTWNHYLAAQPVSGKRKLLDIAGRWLGSSAAGVRIATRFERLAGRCQGTDKDWKQVFTERGIGAVVCASHASPRTLPALQTAKNLGLKTLVINNSWKDVYTTPRIPVLPTRLAVWNQQARQTLLESNAGVSGSTVVVLDSLHLATFADARNVMPREEYSRRMGLDAARPFICYTTAAPTAVRNEERIVAWLAEAIGRHTLPGRPQLLVRLNPMEDGSRFCELQGHPDVLIHKPSWEWNRAADWCCALPEDVPVWVSTVHHAALNVSIPSTVTLEFGVPGKRVINVCFDLPSELPAAESNRRFWEADFYAGIRASGGCVAAFSESELFQQMADAMRRASGAPPGREVAPRVTPVEQALQLTTSVLSE